jgi:hypothetical protein
VAFPLDTDDAPPPAIGTFENEVRNSALTAVVTRHAGLILTLGYVCLALVGMAYNFFYFASFGINVLEFSETSDFLVAAVQSPAVIGLAILPALMIWALVVGRRWLRRRIPRYDAYARRHETQYGKAYLNAFRIMLPTLFLSYAMLFTLEYARRSAGKIIHGTGHRVRVTRTAPIAADSAPRLLVGTTSKYLFFYDTLAKSTDIVPIDNVAALTVALPVRSRRK